MSAPESSRLRSKKILKIIEFIECPFNRTLTYSTPGNLNTDEIERTKRLEEGLSPDDGVGV